MTSGVTFIYNIILRYILPRGIYVNIIYSCSRGEQDIMYTILLDMHIYTAHNNNIYYVGTYLIYDFTNYTRIVSISTPHPSLLLDTAFTLYIKCIMCVTYHYENGLRYIIKLYIVLRNSCCWSFHYIYIGNTHDTYTICSGLRRLRRCIDVEDPPFTN